MLFTVCALGAALTGCEGVVQWQSLQRTPQHQLPRDVVVYVAVSPLVASVDDGGNVSAVVDGLERGLIDAGKRVTIVAARPDEAPPPTRVELQFQVADRGDPELHGAGQLANLMGTPAGVGVITTDDSSDVLVDVYAVPANGAATFAGRIQASNWGSSSGYDSIAISVRAGHTIARALLRHEAANFSRSQ